jgi:hypothetical protein
MNSKEYFIGHKENETPAFSSKKDSHEEKIRMMREVIRKEIPLHGNGIKKGIDTDLFNKCTRDFIEIQNGRFVHNVRSEVTAFELNHLKNQNSLLKQLIAELSHENILLKNKLLNEAKLKASGE